MLVLFRGWILDFHVFRKRRRAEPSETIVGEAREKKKKAPSRFFLVGARALFRAFRSQKAFPLVSPPQLKKQNDKESARDMTGYKPSNFDKGFREGKGWGDLVRRLGKR